MLSGHLDGFTNGIFGGMQVAERIAASQQRHQQTRYHLDVTKAAQATSDDPGSDA